MNRLGHSHCLILQPDGSRTTTVWDFENRSSVIATPANGTQTQAYDSDGLRVKKQDSTGTTHIIFDGQAYLLEHNASNVTIAVYTQEPTTYGYLASQYRFDGMLWVPGYYQQDALGSTMQLTDAGENVTDTYEYDAWGIIQDRTGITENPFEWIGAWGYYKDQTTGLYYVRARNYQSTTGRWTSTDPLLFVDGPNLYVAYFVPNHTDPSGTDRYIGDDTNGNKIYWSGKFCYVTTRVPWIKVPCPNGGRSIAAGTIVGGACAVIGADICTPDPSDLIPPKWFLYAAIGIAAYTCNKASTDQCSFNDCDSGKSCGQSGTRRCSWAGTYLNICGCFSGTH